MPGFLISNTKIQSELNDSFAHSYIDKHEIVDEYHISLHTIKQFENDKCFEKENNYFIVTEGVLLNKHEIVAHDNKISKELWKRYKNEGINLFKELVGSYSGAIYDKENYNWVIWTNHTGDAAVFWCYKDGVFIVGSQYDYILKTLKANGISTTFNRNAAYSMLTYGFMCDNRTYSNEIKRLMPGECIVFDGKIVKSIKYWTLTKKKYTMSTWSKEEILQGLDERFRRAVKLEFDKDQEYGYNHLVDISGGFDARMVNWVAKVLGYGKMLNIHYSQSNSNEEKVSKKLSEYLGNVLLIRPLDEISFIYDIDRIVSMNYGLSLYSGITGGESLLRSLNFNEYGIEHTGMIGDVVIGSFLNSESELSKKELSGMYSTRLMSRMDISHLSSYEDFELQKIYIRGLLGACSSFFIRKKYTEPMAVFLNPDLLEYCMCIPVKYRAKHKLYNEWIMKYYPTAAEFNWTYTDAKITEPHVWVQTKKIVRKGGAMLLHKLKLRTYRQGMNPFSYWYRTKNEFSKFYANYFQSTISMNVFDDALRSDMIDLFNNGTPFEKSQVLTVLASAKLYYPDREEKK